MGQRHILKWFYLYRKKKLKGEGYRTPSLQAKRSQKSSRFSIHQCHRWLKFLPHWGIFVLAIVVSQFSFRVCLPLAGQNTGRRIGIGLTFRMTTLSREISFFFLSLLLFSLTATFRFVVNSNWLLTVKGRLRRYRG